jgi:hypothetical protein
VRDLAALDPCATLVVAFGAWRFSRHSAAVAAALGVGLVLGMGLVVQALHHGRAFDRSVIYAVAAAPRHAVAPSAGGVVSIRGARHRNPSCPSDLRVRLMACSVRGENHGPPLLDTVERRATSESP